MFNILTKKTVCEFFIELRRASIHSDGLCVRADNKTDAVVAMRSRIDDWIEGLQEAKKELDHI